MASWLIFQHLALLRWGDGEGYVDRALVVPARVSRQAFQANPEGQCGDKGPGLRAEATDATLPGKTSKHQVKRVRTANRHR